VISSATLDATGFKNFFETNTGDNPADDTACIVQAEGRQYPVTCYFTKQPVRDYVQAAIDTVYYIHTTQKMGDILVRRLFARALRRHRAHTRRLVCSQMFMTGREEIDMIVRSLGNSGDPNLQPLPL
jgi:hypothetical protein